MESQMLKKFILTTVVCALSSTVFSSPLFPLSEHKKQTKNMQHQVAKAQLIQPHENFSGRWQGTCEGELLTMTIDPQSNWLFLETKIDGETFQHEIEIKGLGTQSKFNSYYHNIEHTYAFWSQNKSELIIDVVNLEKNDLHYPEVSSYVGIYHNTLSLQDNHLVLQGTSYSFEDGELAAPETHACTFSKIEPISTTPPTK